jgi:hypothetical protein
MVKNILLGLGFVALVVASAATSYRVTFSTPVVINGAQLKAGDYQVELKEKTALIKQGKTVTETPVKVENSDQKFDRSSVRLDGTQVEEIRLGGTHTRLVFEKTGNATN